LVYANMADMRDAEDQPRGYLLYRVTALLRPQVTSELRRLGLGLPEFVCMRILSVFPGRSSAELARDTNVSPPAMNQLLRGLQHIGAVTRPAAVSSGRTLPAQLTTKGKKLLKRAEAAARVADEQILTHLMPAEQRQLKQLLYTVGSRATENAEAVRLLRQSEGRPRANVKPRRPPQKPPTQRSTTRRNANVGVA
jgi:DNA-binding MarR family transcriptional regulator